MIETNFGLRYRLLKMTYNYLIRICKHLKISVKKINNILSNKSKLDFKTISQTRTNK